MRKAYLLVYSDATGGRDAIKAWMAREPRVLHWRYDMPHSFYLISEAEAADLSASLIQHTQRKGRFLIMEASPNRQGLLPKESWYLLRNKAQMPKGG